MRFVYNDGGRATAGYRGKTGDCACRSISIATGIPYQTVYDGLNFWSSKERRGIRKRGMSHARTGIHKATMQRYLEANVGWKWVPTMGIGTDARSI
jgi:hypothetical protein